MSATSLVLLIVVVVIALIAIGMAMAMGRRTRLRPLPDDAKARYARSWSAVQARFIEDPRGAVREADQLAVAILRDRGARMDGERNLPRDLMEARAAVGVDQQQADTEQMRRAMLHYERIFDEAIGKAMLRRGEAGRTEVA